MSTHTLSLWKVRGRSLWKVTAWGKNLTDSEYRIYLVDIGLAGFLEEIYGPPQWFGGTISYSF